MIEVEKKFILNESDKNRLTDDAKFLNERVFTDIYYDTQNFLLTSQDKWLRSREGRFELKLPLHFSTDRLMDQYEEFEDEQEIKNHLNFSNEKSLSENLELNNYSPFCICKTTRKKYKQGRFIIDLDTVEFNEFTYHIGEIEIMVNDKLEIPQAINDIMTFAQTNDLTIAPVRGKVIEYIKRIRPEHYNFLINSGIIKI